MKVKSLSHVRLFATPWTVAYQAPPTMGFSRQEYWSGLPFPSPGDLPDPGIQPRSPTLEADALTSEPPVYYIFFSVKVSTGYIIFLIDMGIGTNNEFSSHDCTKTVGGKCSRSMHFCL